MLRLISPIMLIATLLLAACTGSSGTAPAVPTTNAQTGTQSTPRPAATTAQSGNTGATQGQPIPIGIALASTGPVALLGEEQVIGAQVAEEFFNTRGGVNGTPIKLIFQDTAGDEQGAINAFQSLINQSKVVGIVGPTLSQQAFSADPVATQAKVPVVGPSNTAKGIPEIPGGFVSRVSAPVNLIAPQSVEAALKINPQIKRAAVFFAQDDAFSKSETEVFQSVVKSKGLELVTVQTFSVKDTDFTTQATSAINLKPDLAIISGLAQDGGNLVKQLRELGFKGVIIGGNGLNTANIFPVCKAQCDGILVAQAYSPEAESEINNAFKAAYREKRQKDPPQFSAQAFTGVQVFVEALKALDNQKKLSTLSTEDMRVELNKLVRNSAKINTPLGEISIKDGEIIQNTLYVAQIKMDAGGTSGKFTFLK